MKYNEMTFEEMSWCIKHCDFTEEEKEYFLQKAMDTPEGFVIIKGVNIFNLAGKERKMIQKGTREKVEKALIEYQVESKEDVPFVPFVTGYPLKDCKNPKVDISTIIDILGTEYKVRLFVKPEDDKNFQADEYMDGYTDYSTKTIVIKQQEQEDGCMEDLRAYREQVLRHEIVHAFLFESGLHASSDWATNEEIVDWIAIQLPKIIKVIQDLNPKTIEVSCVDEETKEEEDDKNE